jgi:hypothetical protein
VAEFSAVVVGFGHRIVHAPHEANGFFKVLKLMHRHGGKPNRAQNLLADCAI